MNKATEATTWEDGTPRSTGNAFTDHGYVPRSKVAPTPRSSKPGPRQPKAFGVLGGTMSDLGKGASWHDALLPG